jgi:hypothetical protein
MGKFRLCAFLPVCLFLEKSLNIYVRREDQDRLPIIISYFYLNPTVMELQVITNDLIIYTANIK